MRRGPDGNDDQIGHPHFIINAMSTVMLTNTLQNLGVNRVLMNNQEIEVNPTQLLERVVGFLEGLYPNISFISNDSNEYYLVTENFLDLTGDIDNEIDQELANLNLGEPAMTDTQFESGRSANIFRGNTDSPRQFQPIHEGLVDEVDQAEMYYDNIRRGYVFEDDPDRVVHIESPNESELNELIRGITREILASIPPDYVSPSPPPRYRSPRKIPQRRSKPVSPPRKRKVAPKRTTTRKPEKSKAKRKLSKSPPKGRRRR